MSARALPTHLAHPPRDIITERFGLERTLSSYSSNPLNGFQFKPITSCSSKSLGMTVLVELSPAWRGMG